MKTKKNGSISLKNLVVVEDTVIKKMEQTHILHLLLSLNNGLWKKTIYLMNQALWFNQIEEEPNLFTHNV